MITIFYYISNLSDSCNHTLIMMGLIFENVFILFCNCLFYFSYIVVVFTQQHKDNITNSDKILYRTF
jgi:hypothetical protein